MPTLKVLIPEPTYQQLLTIAGRAWRPPLWHAEWLLRRAIEAETARAEDGPPQGDLHEEETSAHVR